MGGESGVGKTRQAACGDAGLARAVRRPAPRAGLLCADGPARPAPGQRGGIRAATMRAQRAAGHRGRAGRAAAEHTGGQRRPCLRAGGCWPWPGAAP